MDKIKKKFITILSIFLLSGVLHAGAHAYLSPESRQQDPGGGGSNPNVNRQITTGGGTASNRPWGESRLTVATAGQVRLVTTGASITGGGNSSNTNSVRSAALNVGDFARTTRLTANRHTNVTFRASFGWGRVGQTTNQWLGELSRNW